MRARLSFALLLAAQLAVLASAAPEPAPPTPVVPQPTLPLRADAKPDATRTLVDLLIDDAGEPKDKAFAKGEYKTLRTAFAAHIDAKHGAEMRAELGADADAFFAWLDQNPDLKETLYPIFERQSTAPKPVIRVLRDLWKYDPEAVRKNDELAIAVAAVWYYPRGVYDQTQHQKLTRSTLPDGVAKVDGVEMFKYVLDRQAKQKAPALPWEFLVHVVNHRSTEVDRDWAVKKYTRKAGLGPIYFDVPYDTEMMRSQYQLCKLTGKPYTLESVLKTGGICGMQADFTTRVSKSLLIPSEYVHGESNAGIAHAWVINFDVKTVTKDAITFTVDWGGRYAEQRYYTGTVGIQDANLAYSDRELDRRLTAFAANPQVSRHATLLMRSFRVVRDARKPAPKQQLAYLNKVLTLYPQCGEAWVELATLHKSGALTDVAEAMRLFDRVGTVFAKFPDFVRDVSDDLLVAQTDKDARTRAYERLAAACEKVARPDLVCATRLKLAEYQAKAEEYKKAFDGLAAAARKFPDEGRDVPRVTKQMQNLAKEIKDGDVLMAKFWLEFLPRVPALTVGEVSPYCVRIHEQALAYLKAVNRPKEAALVEQSLAKLNGKK
jgi:hypothetical protein